MTSVLLVIGLIVLGLALIALEIVVLPGVGLIGGLGLASMIGSGYVAYTELGPTAAALAITGGVVATALSFWLLPKTKAGKAMVLESAHTAKAADGRLAKLVGMPGVAITPLRPSGSVQIDDSPVDVVTDGEYIDAGARVVVAKVEGSRVVVERADN
jgi:membrane-bound serine protease (ClpP class)